MLKFIKIHWQMKQQIMSITCSLCFHTQQSILALQRLRNLSTYQPLETRLSWFLSYISLQASLEQDSDRHRDLRRQIRPIRRKDSLQPYNKINSIIKIFWLKLSVFTSFNIVYFAFF